MDNYSAARPSSSGTWSKKQEGLIHSREVFSGQNGLLSHRSFQSCARGPCCRKSWGMNVELSWKCGSVNRASLPPGAPCNWGQGWQHPPPQPAHCLFNHPSLGPGTVFGASGLEQ